MKIAIVHYRYFISGGPERYLFNIMDTLKKNGHQVIPFSVKHNDNFPSEYENYFLDPIGTGSEIYGYEYKKNFKTIFQAISRVIYSFKAKRQFEKLLEDTKPDLVYILQFQNKISCSVIDAAYKKKIPIVQRISDFGHICIDNILYRYDKKTVCEACLTGSKLNAIKYKCANDSYINSAIKVLALKVHDYLKIREKISSFIFPSNFTAFKFQEFGIPKEKINHIPTFFNELNNNENLIYYNDYFLYVGRVDPDKGLLALVKAFVNTPYKLTIIGFSIEGYDDFLKKYLKDKNHNITFTGKLEFSEISKYLETCLCTVCPSEWYDNMPNAVLESFAFKKAVIASKIGSLQDLITNKKTGLHFETGNVEDLRQRISYMFSNKEEAKQMGENAYNELISKYSVTNHYKQLMNVFNSAIDIKRKKI
jgi:glycosyltransferase involved in cell wall biosynthesis